MINTWKLVHIAPIRKSTVYFSWDFVLVQINDCFYSDHGFQVIVMKWILYRWSICSCLQLFVFLKNKYHYFHDLSQQAVWLRVAAAAVAVWMKCSSLIPDKKTLVPVSNRKFWNTMSTWPNMLASPLAAPPQALFRVLEAAQEPLKRSTTFHNVHFSEIRKHLTFVKNWNLYAQSLLQK